MSYHTFFHAQGWGVVSVPVKNTPQRILMSKFFWQFMGDFTDILDKAFNFTSEVFTTVLQIIGIAVLGICAAAMLAIPFALYCVYRGIKWLFVGSVAGQNQD